MSIFDEDTMLQENIKLFDEVLANNGLFLSEYRLGDNCSRWMNVKTAGATKKMNFTNFPERNRIISAVCQRIIIAQANIKNQDQLKKPHKKSNLQIIKIMILPHLKRF